MKMQIHPLANLFPMMSEDELIDLADDIKANGLVHPIVTDDTGKVLVDGRNRLRACEIAGVEPTFRRLNGEDVSAFIVSVNLARRNLTAGQRAMALAMIYPEPQRGKKIDPELLKKVKTLGKTQNAGQVRLSQGRAVLRHSRSLAQEVLNGTTPLNQAYEAALGAETQEQQRDRRLKQLQAQWSDLADAVTEERMTLEQAEQTANERVEAHKQLRWAATLNLIDGIRPFERPIEAAVELAANYDPAIAAQRGETVTADKIRQAADFLGAVADAMEALNGRKTHK